MKKLLVIFLLVVFPAVSVAGNTVVFFPKASSKTYLLGPIDFEDPPYTNGTDLADVSGEGWTEETSSISQFFVDNSQYKNGSQSAKIMSDTSGNGLHKTYTQQTSGKHTIDFWIRQNSGTGDGPRFGCGAGTAFTSSSDEAVYIRWYDYDLQSYDGSAWVDITTGDAMSDGTWYHLEIEVDVDLHVFKIWVDGTQMGTTFDFRNSVSPLLFGVNGYVASGSVNYYWFDDLSIYAGSRQ